MHRDSRPSDLETGQLPAKGLSIVHLFALFFGTIVGVGWITVSGNWIIAAGPAGAIIAFGCGAVIMTLLGLCYAEAMAAFPSASGAVGYVHFIFGDRMAFWTGWLLVLNYSATIAFFVVSVPWLLETVIPSITGPALYTVLDAPVAAGPLAATAGVGLMLAAINHRGPRAAARLQALIVCLKISVGLCLGLTALFAGRASNLAPAFVGATAFDASYAIAAVAITTPFWFAGFDVLPQAMRERSESVRLASLGRLILVTTGCAMLFYAIIILATGSLLPRANLIASGLPTRDALIAGLGSARLADALLIAAIIGVISGWNAMLFAAARILGALGAARLVPSWFGGTSRRYGTPARAIWSIITFGLLLGLLGRNAVFHLVAAASISLVLCFVILISGLIRLRRSHPDLPRPYRVPGRFTLRTALIIALALVVLFVAEPLIGSRGVPIAWMLLMSWLLIGQLYWMSSGGERDALATAERGRWLAGVAG